MDRSPDPISEPRAYQEHLLALLGEDDPAAAQAATPATLQALVREADWDLRSIP